MDLFCLNDGHATIYLHILQSLALGSPSESHWILCLLDVQSYIEHFNIKPRWSHEGEICAQYKRQRKSWGQYNCLPVLTDRCSESVLDSGGCRLLMLLSHPHIHARPHSSDVLAVSLHYRPAMTTNIDQHGYGEFFNVLNLVIGHHNLLMALHKVHRTYIQPVYHKVTHITQSSVHPHKWAG